MATERPCLLSPNKHSLLQAQRGVGLGWVPVQLLAGAASGFAGTAVLLVRSLSSSALVSPPGSGKEAVGEGGLPHAPGVEEPRWEAHLGQGDVLPTHTLGPFLQTQLFVETEPPP